MRSIPYTVLLGIPTFGEGDNMFDLIKTLKVSIATEDSPNECLHMEVKESAFEGKKYAVTMIKKRNGDFPNWFPYKHKFYQVSDSLDDMIKLYEEILGEWQGWVRPKPICLAVISQKESSEYLSAEVVTLLPIQDAMTKNKKKEEDRLITLWNSMCSDN